MLEVTSESELKIFTSESVGSHFRTRVTELSLRNPIYRGREREMSVFCVFFKWKKGALFIALREGRGVIWSLNGCNGSV